MFSQNLEPILAAAHWTRTYSGNPTALSDLRYKDLSTTSPLGWQKQSSSK